MNVAKMYDKDRGIRVIEATCLVAIYGHMENQDVPYPTPPTVVILMNLLGLKSEQPVHKRIKLMQGHGLLITVPHGQVGGTALTRYGLDYVKNIIAREEKESTSENEE